MLFVKAINLCTALLVFTPYARADEDESGQSDTTEEAGSLLKFITENASSISLIKEIADALQKENADIGDTKKSLRWGENVIKITETTSSSKSQPFVTEKPKSNLDEHNPQSNDAYNPNEVFKNLNGLYHPKDLDTYKPAFIDHTPQTKDVVQNYVDRILTHQNVPALLLHVSLAGVQQSDKALLVSFPVNVNFNNDKKEVTDQWSKEWNLNLANVGSSRPVLPMSHLRTAKSVSEEKDIAIAKAIIDKINK